MYVLLPGAPGAPTRCRSRTAARAGTPRQVQDDRDLLSVVNAKPQDAQRHQRSHGQVAGEPAERFNEQRHPAHLPNEHTQRECDRHREGKRRAYAQHAWQQVRDEELFRQERHECASYSVGVWKKLRPHHGGIAGQGVPGTEKYQKRRRQCGWPAPPCERLGSVQGRGLRHRSVVRRTAARSPRRQENGSPPGSASLSCSLARRTAWR